MSFFLRKISYLVSKHKIEITLSVIIFIFCSLIEIKNQYYKYKTENEFVKNTVKRIECISNVLFSKPKVIVKEGELIKYLIECLKKFRLNCNLIDFSVDKLYQNEILHPVIVYENGIDIENRSLRIMNKNIIKENSLFSQENKILYSYSINCNQKKFFLIVPIKNNNNIMNFRFYMHIFGKENILSIIFSIMFFVIAFIFHVKIQNFIRTNVIGKYKKLLLDHQNELENSNSIKKTLHSIRNISEESKKYLENYAKKHLEIYEHVSVLIHEVNKNNNSNYNIDCESKNLKKILFFDFFKKEYFCLITMVRGIVRIFNFDLREKNDPIKINIKGRGVFHTDKDFLFSLFVYELSIIFKSSKGNKIEKIDINLIKNNLNISIHGKFFLGKSDFDYPQNIKHELSIKNGVVTHKINIGSFLSIQSDREIRELSKENGNIIPLFHN